MTPEYQIMLAYLNRATVAALAFDLALLTYALWRHTHG